MKQARTMTDSEAGLAVRLCEWYGRDYILYLQGQPIPEVVPGVDGYDMVVDGPTYTLCGTYLQVHDIVVPKK